jgi:S1-C subfamily serine protease
VFIDTTATRPGEGDIFGPSVVQTEGEASGVVVDPSGYVVTNNHVVEGASEIRVSLSDNRQFAAEVVGADPGSDLAVLKIPATDLIAASWGDSSVLDAGDWVLAIGNPYGLDRTVTFGIISAKNRRGVGNSPTQEFLQTDAAVNPGNSGGPLVNMAGQVIGINTAIIGPSYQGISFALPSNAARDVYEKLKSGQRVVRGWLGVAMGPVNPADAPRLGLKSTRGALLRQVVPGSPASKAGLQAGDVVIQWDGHAVDDPNLLRLLVAQTKPGTTVKATVIRQGHEQDLDVTVGESPPR